MTAYRRGDVVLVNFVFANERGVKRRPALIISAEPYQRGRQEVILAAITSNVGRLLVGDHLIADWQGAGLLYPSVATGIIRTTKQAMIARKLGTMLTPDLPAIENALRVALGL